jgi:hypothetical protein
MNIGQRNWLNVHRMAAHRLAEPGELAGVTEHGGAGVALVKLRDVGGAVRLRDHDLGVPSAVAQRASPSGYGAKEIGVGALVRHLLIGYTVLGWKEMTWEKFKTHSLPSQCG